MTQPKTLGQLLSDKLEAQRLRPQPETPEWWAQPQPARPVTIKGFRAPTPRPLASVFGRLTFRGGRHPVLCKRVQTWLGPATELLHPALTGRNQTTVHAPNQHFALNQVFVGSEEYRWDDGELVVFIQAIHDGSSPDDAIAKVDAIDAFLDNLET